MRDLVVEPPLLNASGAFDIAAADPEWSADAATARPLGAYVTKTVTRLARAGNPGPWVEMIGRDTLVNAVGLANPGIDAIARAWDELPALLQCPIVLSIGGTPDELASMVLRAERDIDWVAAYELNLSCPNVSGEAVLAGADPARVRSAVEGVRGCTERPVFAKLGPACGDVAGVARAAELAGADAITAVNTMPVRALDDDGAQMLGVPDGGMSGAALHPIALRVVAHVAAAVSVPVIGVGGVATRASAQRMFASGARAVGVGTAAAIAPSVLADIASLWAARSVSVAGLE